MMKALLGMALGRTIGFVETWLREAGLDRAAPVSISTFRNTSQLPRVGSTSKR